MQSEFDFIVIGGGILGLSTARQLQQRFPGKRVLVLEKESSPAQHQTGHNSGVIHAGVYYKPGSLKAKFCKEGNAATKAFCREYDIPFDECGKLLVATNELELERMQGLIGRCAENELPIEVLDAEQLKAREPNISGVGAIFVPSTGIVSYTRICEKMAELVEADGGVVRYNTEVRGIREHADGIEVETELELFSGNYLVSCAGLMSDRVVRMLGQVPDFKIIPFRGEYFLLPPEHNRIVNHLIYPIPDPDLPFLGVHLTRMIDGTVTVGPNAVLAFKREGYRKTDFSLRDMAEMLTYPGLLKMLARNLKPGLMEMKNSLFRRGYLEQVRKYCPQLTLADLKPYPAGVRAQAVAKDGSLVDDFLFVNTRRALVVCNAPSPAATSAIPIGAHIVDQVEKHMAS
ncbi:L-2-hydroxyglutarate oxidase [Marinobacterium sediminicola]|uniref:L-2-hydroxyglutarate oxidase n=1 Tax=Marinobacterium sediminicola TaxID=518898 RepID=A0ABY1RWB9_9GAMM|nr:L-2-hydroxyglutarate oxidase [Marinobacterium sediminicola]ULG70409.1 L-2-hydroxyglutarate oxidase [Marinobacterium sediminicola]SMR69434.1 L-2-hydroxyglutarate oxidase [Marinobacterium sediminicola]